jgi:hypothetical protein
VAGGPIERIGPTLRRVPGPRHALDARVAWRRRRERLADARREADLDERDRRWIASLVGRKDLRLNLGSSGSHVEGWISADLVRDADGRCIRMDATARWPFADGSAEAVTSEHFLEHVERDAAPAYLREAFRGCDPHLDARPGRPLQGLRGRGPDRARRASPRRLPRAQSR